MMRKLAVTVFALSFAALGCGSDSGSKTPDTAVTPDGGPKAEVAGPVVDATGTPDIAMGETQPPVDTAKVETAGPDVPQVLDQAAGEASAPIDGVKGVDGSAIDGPKTTVDGGVDAKGVDGGSTTVDSGSVDSASVG